MRSLLTTACVLALTCAAASNGAEPLAGTKAAPPAVVHMPSLPGGMPGVSSQQLSAQQQAELQKEFLTLYGMRPESHDANSCSSAGLAGDPSNTQIPMTTSEGSKFEQQMFKVFINYDIMQLESGLRQECEQQYIEKQLNFLIKLRLYELAKEAYPNQPIPIPAK